MSAEAARIARPVVEPSAVVPRRRDALVTAGAAWLAVAVAGQCLFAYYVLAFYGGAALRGDWSGWNAVFPRGHVPGDWAGNAMVASHLGFTVIVVLAGAVQLLPVVRRRVPALHRWSGRTFALGAVVLALGGLAMLLGRGAVGDWTQQLALAGNALLLLACAAQAVRHARARRFELHRAWALRLWVAVAGVWFFRVGVASWLLVHRAPVGFDPETFTGPFLTALAFGQYLVPLALLELWLRTDRRGGPLQRAAVAALFGGLAVATLGGIAAATLILWLPRL